MFLHFISVNLKYRETVGDVGERVMGDKTAESNILIEPAIN